MFKLIYFQWFKFFVSENKLTAEEKKKAQTFFEQNIRQFKTPGKNDCLTCITTLKLSTDWLAIKYFVYNKIVATGNHTVQLRSLETKQWHIPIRPLQIDYLADGFRQEMTLSGGRINGISTFFNIVIRCILLFRVVGS